MRKNKILEYYEKNGKLSATLSGVEIFFILFFFWTLPFIIVYYIIELSLREKEYMRESQYYKRKLEELGYEVKIKKREFVTMDFKD